MLKNTSPLKFTKGRKHFGGKIFIEKCDRVYLVFGPSFTTTLLFNCMQFQFSNSYFNFNRKEKLHLS